MRIEKKLIFVLASFVAFFGVHSTSIAGDNTFGLSPEKCHETISTYLQERLWDPRAARVRLDGEPYAVEVQMRGDEATAWAQDVYLKSRLPSGSWSNYQPYTIIFQNGVAVALGSDLSKVERV